MDKNFKVRVSVGVIMFIVAIIALYTFDAVPFKIIFSLFAIISAIELFSFFKRKKSFTNTILAFFEILFLIWGTIFIAHIDASHFWYIILGVPGYDIFAYLFGNKTWEGTFCGLTMAIGMVAILLAVQGEFATNWYYLFCGPLALIGDLYESFLKRRFNVKDSNEILIKNKFFEKLEMLVGGSEGHGGFLDRIDSTAFTCTILLIVSSLL